MREFSRFSGIVISIVALAGCTAAKQESPIEPSIAAAASTKVGNRFWLGSSPVYICAGPPTPTEMTTIGTPPCIPTKRTTFIVESSTKGRVVNGYVIRFDNGKTGWIADLDLSLKAQDEAAHKRELAEQAECNRKGGVAVGMTRAQVYASCWGKPQRVNVTRTANGDSEQLVYWGNYVYLRNGIVTAIQTSQ